MKTFSFFNGEHLMRERRLIGWKSGSSDGPELLPPAPDPAPDTPVPKKEKTKEDLQAEIDALKRQNEALQAARGVTSNPSYPAAGPDGVAIPGTIRRAPLFHAPGVQNRVCNACEGHNNPRQLSLRCRNVARTRCNNVAFRHYRSDYRRAPIPGETKSMHIPGVGLVMHTFDGHQWMPGELITSIEEMRARREASHARRNTIDHTRKWRDPLATYRRRGVHGGGHRYFEDKAVAAEFGLYPGYVPTTGTDAAFAAHTARLQLRGGIPLGPNTSNYAYIENPYLPRPRFNHNNGKWEDHQRQFRHFLRQGGVYVPERGGGSINDYWDEVNEEKLHGNEFAGLRGDPKYEEMMRMYDRRRRFGMGDNPRYYVDQFEKLQFLRRQEQEFQTEIPGPAVYKTNIDVAGMFGDSYAQIVLLDELDARGKPKSVYLKDPKMNRVGAVQLQNNYVDFGNLQKVGIRPTINYHKITPVQDRNLGNIRGFTLEFTKPGKFQIVTLERDGQSRTKIITITEGANGTYEAYESDLGLGAGPNQRLRQNNMQQIPDDARVPFPRNEAELRKSSVTFEPEQVYNHLHYINEHLSSMYSDKWGSNLELNFHKKIENFDVVKARLMEYGFTETTSLSPDGKTLKLWGDLKRIPAKLDLQGAFQYLRTVLKGEGDAREPQFKDDAPEDPELTKRIEMLQKHTHILENHLAAKPVIEKQSGYLIFRFNKDFRYEKASDKNASKVKFISELKAFNLVDAITNDAKNGLGLKTADNFWNEKNIEDLFNYINAGIDQII